MNTQHTPGPWTVSAKYQIRKAEGVPMLLAEVNNSEGAQINGYNAEANARLIAAAPELLKAAQTAASISERCNNAMLPKHVQELLKSITETLLPAINTATGNS